MRSRPGGVLAERRQGRAQIVVQVSVVGSGGVADPYALAGGGQRGHLTSPYVQEPPAVMDQPCCAPMRLCHNGVGVDCRCRGRGRRVRVIGVS